MSKQKLILFKSLIVFTLFFYSCGKDLVLENFNEEAWKLEKNACSSVRGSLSKEVLRQKKLIIGQPETNIISTLGKPDKVEIFPKNVKQLIYFTEPGPDCVNGEAGPERLIIEVNSLGNAKLVYIQNP